MKFLMLYTPANKQAAPSPELMETMGRYIEEQVKAGVLLSTEGLAPGERGVLVERSGGELIVKDGPYAEAKEVIGGYALIQAKSMAEAIGHAKTFLSIAGDGVTEVHRVAEASDFSPDVFTPEQQAREAQWRQQMAANK